jgi:hypothetical protein
LKKKFLVGAALAATMSMIAAAPAPAATIQTRFTQADLTSAETDILARQVAEIYDQIYTEVVEATDYDVDSQIADALGEIEQDLALSAASVDNVEQIADSYATTAENAELVERVLGYEPSAVVDHSVEPMGVTAVEDTTTGNLLVTASTEVTVTYDDGIEGAEIVETLAVVDGATGEFLEVRQLELDDCAALVDTGFPGDGGWAYSGRWVWQNSDKYWWYQEGALGTQTRSWVNAENWCRFARVESKRAGVLTSPSSPVVGDIVQIKYAGKSVIEHSMIVTRRNAKGKICVTYHTTNTKNKPLSDIIAKYPKATFFAHRI